MTTAVRVAPIVRATGNVWIDWLSFTRDIGAYDLSHYAIAEKVVEQLDEKVENLAWWAQTITVAYEQDIDLRLPRQRPDGTFETSLSRTTGMSKKSLIETWTAFAEVDDEVQELISSEPRRSEAEKRIAWHV